MAMYIETTADGRTIALSTEPVEQEAPGLAGVTISSSDDFSLSLDRGPGGLQARAQLLSGAERTWRVLGASRGEPGILGEGVRQALADGSITEGHARAILTATDDAKRLVLLRHVIDEQLSVRRAQRA